MHRLLLKRLLLRQDISRQLSEILVANKELYHHFTQLIDSHEVIMFITRVSIVDQVTKFANDHSQYQKKISLVQQDHSAHCRRNQL